MRILCSECSKDYAPGTMGRCRACEGILRPEYPVEVVKKLREIAPGPGIGRYKDLFPLTGQPPSLGEGDTPLIPSRRTGQAMGLTRLYFKVEGCNPSGSFKDRVGVIAAGLALERGLKGIVTASSGNAAAAISAYSAAAGLKCLILIEPGSPASKIRQTIATGARVIPVEGVFDHGPEAISTMILQLAETLDYYPAFVWAPVNPYLLEGVKTMSYEIVARLGKAPDMVISPVGGGDMLAGEWRGYLELSRAGLTEGLPRMVGVQSSAAPPLVKAFRSASRRVKPLPCAGSRISGINVPFTGEHALEAVRESGGIVIDVDDEEAFALQQRVAMDEGLWIEPVSAVPLAALKNLLDQGLVEKDDLIVCVMSGAGFKDDQLGREAAEKVSRRKSLPFDIEAILTEAEALKASCGDVPVRPTP
ncbi:MAG: pyridoxal-phosphate dependent enzyme [Deltaproteobacteria bacterium]|nr:pyridoxal-phosphate dependent enzyme [Deltaproteobacteria bacterium]